ncbi:MULTISPECIES: hypothetical protein [Acidithiobacillus]|jgi:hypothetical protein|uniref:Uncharacterized protein n=2 Tax=Acidithiobacillus TaxID=119977 RepID=A0A179B6F2_ACIFR|nr:MULTISPECIES: hypothetical protein [Acidithiobacillus]MBU2845215.1 hypothetical protein [Acidithiobacillus ferriphilus]MEB8474437.1 hypothetical protein [Acidithiobacillus ferriphilus]MEB8486629.1 hypothetical protein [Acidithiobacillus ferriphilus]MEB8490902.1 hypothetical protein [Acidithiobacillus ferriphilus]MEB8493363.1 hypothetical protein [Acidithiobacillus ferriphilus]
MECVKVVGSNGQISLGKQYAGRQVLVEETEPGVWLVRTARVVPDNERWLQHSEASNDLRNALAWAQNNAPDDSGVDDFMAQIGQ